MSFTTRGKEEVAKSYYEQVWQGGTIEIRDSGPAVLGSASIPASNDADLVSPDGTVANDTAIVITPSSDGTANDVVIKDSGGNIVNTFVAGNVLDSTNIVNGNDVTIAIGDLSLTQA